MGLVDSVTMPKYIGGLGFRDIEIFNLYLLANKAWRLLQELDSLSAHVLKASYYPNDSFLTDSLESHPHKYIGVSTKAGMFFVRV